MEAVRCQAKVATGGILIITTPERVEIKCDADTGINNFFFYYKPNAEEAARLIGGKVYEFDPNDRENPKERTITSVREVNGSHSFDTAPDGMYDLRFKFKDGEISPSGEIDTSIKYVYYSPEEAKKKGLAKFLTKSEEQKPPR